MSPELPTLPEIEIGAADQQAAQHARLSAFLRFLGVMTAIFCSLELVGFLLFRDLAFGIAFLISIGFFGCVLLARVRLRRSGVQSAALLVAVGLLLTALSGVLAWPEYFPMLVLLPLLAVATTLPYLAGAVLHRLTMCAWLAAVLVALFGELLPSHSSAPLWFISFFRIASLVTAVALVLFMLWQFSSRLNETLAELRRSHAALQASEQRFRFTFEQAAVGIGHVSPSGTWLRVNEKLCAIVGYTRQELLQHTFQEITYPEDLELDLAYVQQMLDNQIKTYSMEKRYIHKNGSLVWINLTVSLVRRPDGQPDYFISVVEDISERKRIEAERDRLYGETQQALQSRDEFFLLAAHELKTPLTAILSSAQLLQRRVSQLAQVSERDQRTTAILVDQARRLYRLISSLLDLSRLQDSSLSIEPGVVDLCALVQQLVDELQPTLNRHTFKLQLPAQPQLVWGDRLRLEQVLQNVLHNAIKYSPQGGTIAVQVVREDQQVLVTVSDSGIGIPAEDLPRIFERFYRARNINIQQLSGMGVGLYVVREVIALHGGTIKVQSQEGRGTTVQIGLRCHEDVAMIEPD